MTLTELFDHGKTFASYMFDKTGEVQPMWICITEDGEILPIMVPMIDDKDLIASALRKLLKDKRVIRYVSMMEGWMLLAKNKNQSYGDMIKSGPIRNNPDRKEVLTIEAADRTGRSKMGLFLIHRDGHKPYLSQFDLSEGDHAGRFSNLLMEIQ